MRALDPSNEDAYKAIVYLHGQVGHDEKVRELLAERAHDLSLPDEERAFAFVILASKQWQCSHDITERKENKVTRATTRRGSARVPVKYKKPANPPTSTRPGGASPTARGSSPRPSGSRPTS